MSADLKADILKVAHDAEHLQKKQDKKVIKRCKYFLIKFPNGAEALIKCDNGWVGLNDYIKYFKDKYEESIVAVSITKSEAFKFVLKGRLFTC